LTPAALSTITTTYTSAQRTTALAAWGAIGAAGAAVGVLVGGALTTFLGWQSIFFINVPIGLIAFALGLRLVPPSAAIAKSLRELDLPGAAAVTAGLVLVVFTIDGLTAYGWGSARTLLPLALAATSFAVFLGIERFVERPLVPPATWRIRSLVSGVGMMVGTSGVMGGAFFLNSLYLQTVLGATALQAGLAFLPFALAITAASHVGSRLVAHLTPRSLLGLGLAAVAGGELLLARAPDHASYVANLLPGFLVLGGGLGLGLVAIAVTVMAEVKSEQAGLASGLMSTGHEIGVAIGVAAFSAIASTGAAQYGFASGYADALVAAALVAATLIPVSLLAVPAGAPVGAARAALHAG
jgi:MFS family permease